MVSAVEGELHDEVTETLFVRDIGKCNLLGISEPELLPESSLELLLCLFKEF